MYVCPTIHPITRSHGTMGHSTGCPPVLLLDACVSHCPSHRTIPWTMGHSTGCPPVPLADACVSYCPSHPMIPWDHRTFHGMSTCPFHRCVCVPLFIPSHGTMGHSTGCPTVFLSDMCVAQTIPSPHGFMGPWDIPRDVQLSLS